MYSSLYFLSPPGSVRTLLNTVDAAIFYTSRNIGTTCGQVDSIDPVRSNTLPVAFVAKDCSTFVLAHELGYFAWCKA